MKAKYIRDNVSGYGKDIVKATNKKFDINNALIIKACNGDETALKQLGDMGKTGERLQMAMPAIRENLKAYINGITEYNTSLADIYREGGTGAASIDKAGGDVSLANNKYLNKIEEYKTSLFASLKAENQRHDDSMDVIELKAWIDTQMATVSAKAQMEGISNRPMIAQMQSDRDYESAKINHILQNGSDSDLSLIPRKEFDTNPVVKAWHYVRSIFS
jgi:hypothetical protein